MNQPKDDSQHTDLNGVTQAVRELGEVMRLNGLTKIDVEVDGLTIKMRAGGGKVRTVMTSIAEPAEFVPSAASPASAPVKSGHAITAPMIGTFYHSAAPGQPAFVQVGDRIDAGQTIGIIEAMKIMNEISADRGGFVDEIVAGNGQAVEYGSVLIRLVSDGGAG